MSSKITRISSEELSAFAQQGIRRAMEAREAAGVELSQEQLDQVSGGASLSQLLSVGVIAGGPWWLDQFNGFDTGVTNPAAGVGGLAVDAQVQTMSV
ncbi:hypothetical protein QZJ86_12610 [Methylomonas montana]|uniref:hypothetical protein n=1 Tax=Methylomonas montana TaxID=3058963 RepID=UPI002659C224|nr:hypothetical protein [Methylomonas montana]WKJ88863.1 hypothetical protein QZJ86_12610 [Methylomonas montana]